MKEMVVEETNLYASQNNNTLFQFTMSDLNSFNVILMLTGYHSYPGHECFGKKKMLNFLLFEAINKYLHFVNNDNLDLSYKFLKVRKLCDVMNKNIQQFGFLYTHYSIAEQIVPITGKNSSKQAIRTNSI